MILVSIMPAASSAPRMAADPAIHHVGRAEHIDPGLRLHQGLLHQHGHAVVVMHVAVTQHPVMAVRRVAGRAPRRPSARGPGRLASAAAQRWHIRFSGLAASVPSASFSSAGVAGNKATRGMPRSTAGAMCATNRSTLTRCTPGIEATVSTRPLPGRMKTGQIRSSTESRFSATRRRVQPSRRLRRMRVAGYRARVMRYP